MSAAERWMLAVSLILVDLVLFVLPLTGLLAAYVLVLRPAWFRQWIERLYAGHDSI